MGVESGLGRGRESGGDLASLSPAEMETLGTSLADSQANGGGEETPSAEQVAPPTPQEEALAAIKSGDRVAIVGSRDFSDLGAVRDFVRSLPADTTVVSGGARGVDSAAETAASSRGLPVKSFPADWNRFGRSAGIRRNADIVRNSDVVVAFHQGGSRGTQNSIDLARGMGKPVFIIPPPNQP